MLMRHVEHPYPATAIRAAGIWQSRAQKAVIKRVCLRAAATLVLGGLLAASIALTTAITFWRIQY